MQFQNFTRNCRIKNLDEFERDEGDAYLWRAEILIVKEKGMTILHYDQVLGNIFQSRESKCCAVLMKYRHKVKSEQVITPKWLSNKKPKILVLYQTNYFVVSVKLNFC